MTGSPGDSRKWVIAANEIAARLQAGQYPPGQWLPTVTELAASLDTSTTTIVAALSELRALGLVSQATGKSSYYAGDGDPPGGDKQKRPRTEPTQAQYAGMLGQRYLTISEVAAIVRLSKMTIYRLAWEGKLAGAIQVGRALRVPESGVQEYLKGCLITSQGTGLEEFISAMDETEE